MRALSMIDLRYKPSHYVIVLWFGLICLAFSIVLVLCGNVAWPWLLGTWFIYSFMAMTNSAGFHRLFSHGSYQTNRFWEWFLLLTGTLSCYGSSFQWTVVHTQHHKYSDTDQDPHRFNHWTEMFKTNYVIEKVSFKSKRAIRWLLKRPGHAFVHRHYWAFPMIFTLILGLISFQALLYLYFAPLGLVIFSAALFNYISHGDDGPNNAAFYSLQASGEWRHKLHHDKPWLWDLREKWYHIDLGAYFIKLIKKNDDNSTTKSS